MGKITTHTKSEKIIKTFFQFYAKSNIQNTYIYDFYRFPFAAFMKGYAHIINVRFVID